MLFATLDPTTRKLCLPGGKEVLLTDTVGFIQKLPTKLVASFRATLNELADSTLLLHVVDASSPLAPQQVRSVQRIVAELDAAHIPQVLVLNKADMCGDGVEGDAAAALAATDWTGLDAAVVPEAIVPACAKDGRGAKRLLLEVEKALMRMTARVSCVVPYSAAALLAEVHKTSTIEEEEFADEGTRIVAFVPPSLRNRLEKACATFSVDGAVAAPMRAVANHGEGGGGGRERKHKRKPRAASSP